jgi:hypothetical protein
MLVAAGLMGAAALWAQTPLQATAQDLQQIDAAKARLDAIQAQRQALLQDMQQRYVQQVQTLAAGGRAGIRILPIPAAETGKPFSATITTHTSQTYSDGTNVNQTTTVVQYRDAEGRTRVENDAPGGKLISIRDPVAGVVYSLDAAAKTVVQRPIAGAGGARGGALASPTGDAPPVAGARGGRGARGGSMTTASGADAIVENGKRNPNNTVEDLGMMTVNGVPARGTRITNVIPVGAIGNDREFRSVDERWYSPDLNMLVKSVSTDPRFGTTTREMSNISRANPDRSLFEVPADYKVVSTGQ